MTRDLVRQQLSDVAIDLFAERGFECVTVEQVAAAAGVSTRSVHRYFPAKEDMVVGALAANGGLVKQALAARSMDEPVMEALHSAFAAMLRSRPQTIQDRKAIRLIASTPSLRARNVEKYLAWAELLTPLVEQRLDGADTSVRSSAIIQAGLAAFSVALTAWAETEETRPIDEMLRIAFRDLIRD